MKSLNEIKKEKQSLLGGIDFSQTGGLYVGSNTEYHGPKEPESIQTELDGLNIGRDGFSGSLGGDIWRLDGSMMSGFGYIYITTI